MMELIFLGIALAGVAAACWYCYRWGFADGRAEGFADGRNDASEPQGGGGPKPEK